MFKLSRIPYPSEGGQNKTPGNLVRVLGWHGRRFCGQVCLLGGPGKGNCLWPPAQPSARQRRIVWKPVFSFPNCCTSTHQSLRHNISYQRKGIVTLANMRMFGWYPFNHEISDLDHVVHLIEFDLIIVGTEVCWDRISNTLVTGRPQ